MSHPKLEDRCWSKHEYFSLQIEGLEVETTTNNNNKKLTGNQLHTIMKSFVFKINLARIFNIVKIIFFLAYNCLKY